MQQPMQPGQSPAWTKGGGASLGYQLPTWPQKFEVQGPESDSFGFAVTQAGPIAIDVQAQGAPLLVTLQSTGGRSITQPATGGLRMSYTVTPQDVQRTLFWYVEIRLAQPMPPFQGGRASGTVNVQHPPVNTTQVQAAVAAQQQVVQQQAAQLESQAKQMGPQTVAQMEQAFQQRKARFQQEQMARRSAMMAKIQPQVTQLQNRLGRQIRPRGIEGGDGPENTEEVGETTEEIGTRALKSADAPLAQAPSGHRQQMMSAIQETAASQQALGTAGSGPPPQQVISNPSITSLSVSEGQPGDPVMINGSAFSNGGEVHFIVNAGKDLVAPVQVWTDTQIFATVPDIAGVLSYNGVVYVVRGSDQAKSTLVPWRFNPTLELRELRWTLDRRLTWPFETEASHRPTTIAHGNGNPFIGYKNDDEFFVNTRLKNGWVADDAWVICSVPWGNGNCDGGAYYDTSRPGTDSPYLKVHWWVPPSFGGYKYTYYTYAIRIVGPKGTPDGVAVP
jgi:hypothetical protein